MESVPTATTKSRTGPTFVLKQIDGRATLCLTDAAAVEADAGPAQADAGGGAAARWAVIETLELEIPDLRPPTGSPSVPDRRFQNRRSVLARATLRTDRSSLEAALATCPLAAFGITEARIAAATGGGGSSSSEGDGGLRLVGRAAAGGHEAAFSVRVTSAPRVPGPRWLCVTLGDVRVYGQLPIAAPLLGARLAAAIAAGVSPPLGSALRQIGYALEMDPLELALVPTLVAAGWRLPDLGGGRLDGLARGGGSGDDDDGALRLTFAAGPPRDPAEAQEPATPQTSAPAAATLEGQPLPESLRAAEETLLAGDLAAAEAAFREAMADDRHSLAAHARLLSIRVAAGGDDVTALADAITARWPDFIPAWLAGAVAASAARDAPRSAALFRRVAALAEARGEADDAALARAEADARTAGAGAAGATEGPDGDGDIADADADAGLAALTEDAIARGDLAGAEQLFVQRLDLARQAGDRMTAARLTVERASARMQHDASGAAVEAALMHLRELRLAETPEEGLALRAQLAERIGDWKETRETLAEMETRARWAGDTARAGDLALRIARAGTTAEEIHARAAALYAELAGAGALSSLAAEIERLTPDEQPGAFAALGQVAEGHGDLTLAEHTYWRAASGTDDAAARAGLLVAHARVLLAQGDTAGAIPELEEALALWPGHAGALALLADEAFRARDWPRARQLYAGLAEAPSAAEAITRLLLVTRRAVLAHAAGDLEEAEGHYQELAALDPGAVEARQLLAEVALGRQDLAAAAHWMEEVLQILPGDAGDLLSQARERLGEIYVGLEDWPAARYYLELALAQEPGRISTLERLVVVRERLGLNVEAADLCVRLARLYPDPARRAEAMFQRGEILRERLHDEEGAFEAYLKSSDLDPTYPPTALRLVVAFWLRGSMTDSGGVAEDLRRIGPLPPLDPPLRIRIGIAVAVARQDVTRGVAAAELPDLPWDADAAADALAEVTELLAAHPVTDLDRAADLLDAWRAAARGGGGGGGDGGASASVAETLQARVVANPAAAIGMARALARLAERAGETERARALLAVAVFADDDPGGGEGSRGEAARLDDLNPVASPDPAEDDLALGGPTDHPDLRRPAGAAALRRVLAALARGLAGFGPLGSRTVAAEDTGIEAMPAAVIHAAGDRLGAPARRLCTTDKQTPDNDVLAIPTTPAVLEIPEALAGAPETELGFLAARALDRLRNGIALVDAVTGGMSDDVVALLGAARAALTGTAPPEGRVARAATHALKEPERRAALLGGASPTEMVEDVGRAEGFLADDGWETFRDALDRAADRFAALLCPSPLAALRALARIDIPEISGIVNLTARERRLELLGTARVRALVGFLLAPRRPAPADDDDALER